MKKIFTILMLAAGVIAANATELVCEGLVARHGNNNCKYQPTYSWTAGNSNTMQVFALEAGALSDYASILITLSDFVDMTEGQTVGGANKVRLLFIDGNGTTVKTQSFATINGAEKNVTLSTIMTDEQIASIVEIAFGGACDAGCIVVDPTSIKLMKADSTVLACAGFVHRQNNNQCSYGHALSWTASTANTMQLFAFEAGTLSGYDHMYLTLSNFKDMTADKSVGGGNKVRVLFLTDSTTVKTQSYATINGSEKEIVLAEQMTAEEIASVTMIAIGGACEAGMIEVEAESIRLTGEGSGITELRAEPKAYKVVENGHIVIIRDGVRFDLTGKRMQ
mgnify:CR=1 FL=1